jgi:hypothetical protein
MVRLLVFLFSECFKYFFGLYATLIILSIESLYTNLYPKLRIHNQIISYLECQDMVAEVEVTHGNVRVLLRLSFSSQNIFDLWPTTSVQSLSVCVLAFLPHVLLLLAMTIFQSRVAYFPNFIN